MFPLASGVAMGQGAAALSITLNKEGFDPLVLAGPASSNQDSNPGEIDVTASAAGGDGSYTYAWTVAEILGDDTDTGAGALSILAAGTQNAAQYDSLTLRGVPASGPPAEVTYRLTCTVTDGASAEAAATIDQPVTVLAL